MPSFLGTLFGGEAEKEAAGKNTQALQNYGQLGTQYLTNSYNQGRGDLGQAVGAFAPLAQLGQQYNQAGALNLDALGVNGPEGNARATSAFQAGPGYGFAFDQGMDALNRRRAAGGMLNSGNADVDAIRFGQGTANQEYQNWLANLQKNAQMGLSATGGAAAGQAGAYGSLANLASQYGQNLTGLTGNVTSGMMDANKLTAAGEAAGAKNILGAGMSLASLAMGGMGGLGGGLGGSLFGNALGGAMGGSYGGSAQAPLPGLSASDYGPGASFLDQYGLG
jgi:hypothetical protein